MSSTTQKQIVWLITDGKPGHQNQSEGLVQALAEKTPIRIMRLPVLPFWKTLYAYLVHKHHLLKLAPKPVIVIGAGHATHATLLLTKILFGTKTIVLMKPSLPLWLFNLAVIPEHDKVKPGNRVEITRGVLNKIKIEGDKKINQGVMLIGGPSRHHDWNEAQLLEQLNKIIDALPHIEWVIADSRRTPAETSGALKQLAAEKVTFVSCEEVDSDWLPALLSASTYAWVTVDSVSMVYEALTAQCQVGLLDVPPLQQSRVSRGLQSLVDENYAVTFRQWQADESFGELKVFASEAERCAGIINRRFMK